MRRIALIAGVVVAIAAIVATGAMAGDGEGGDYEVRAIFDSAGFLVPGEDVRIAGANVGTVAEVDVTGTDDAVHEDGRPDPGKAVAVLNISDEGFQDFRTDASCLIRPQSLIGEKYVECEPTQPRAPGTVAPPPLEVIGDDEPGEGQHLLPLERNGKAVDLDIVNDVMKEPYPDRFRLILNDLGAGLAARGEELAEIVERSNPALRETNEVLDILASQNRALSKLSSDSDSILSALARERESVVGFINESTVVGQATAERRADLEASIAKLPGFLRELRSTMTQLERFADAATPVFADLGRAAPSLTRASRALGPFSSGGIRALTTLGDAADETAAPLVASDPVIRQVRNLAKDAKPATKKLARTLATLRKTGGFEGFLETLFGVGGAINAFDNFGHFVRALIPTNSCFDYTSRPQPGCGANFSTSTAAAAAAASAGTEKLLRELARSDRAREARRTPGLAAGATRTLMDFLLGDPAADGQGDSEAPSHPELAVPGEDQPEPDAEPETGGAGQ
ncbi:MAG TPA: MlaD family protein [Solirubrobacterales bacterium]|jgi:ABC-type transporter Mla subunit MlaD|nr:MlaD family protein [Solirubrobacterales bacterium]